MRLIDADALLKHEIEADRMGAMLVVGKGYILSAPEVNAVPVVRGEWVDDENGTEWDSHQCSVCKKSPLSETIYEDDYDEGLDGEWFYLGKRENGIIEHLTNLLPQLRARMDGEKR